MTPHNITQEITLDHVVDSTVLAEELSLESINKRLDEISRNHTIVLQNLRDVQEEHIRQVKQINNHFAEIERDIKDIRRHIRTENFEQLNNDMLANLNSVRQQIAKLNDSVLL